MKQLLLASALCAHLWLASLAAATTRPVPLFDTLGDYSRPIATQSAEAQRYFDQGLRFLFGFNHGLAIRSFEEAARLAPDCAMTHWAVALACGPHINFPAVPPDRAEQAWQALTLAQRHAATASPVEQALIAALGHRYAMPQPEDRSPLDVAYADAMREVWRSYPQDADVGVFFAEALMNLRPWDQWTPAGEAQPGTEEVIATLDAVLALNERHPFANHLYIHAVEASPQPERAIAAANRLRDLQPGLAHNVHMPSHIDIRVGDWHQAVTSNLRAIAADQAIRKVLGPPRDLVVIYAAHNRHMLAYAAMMTGQSALALEHIRTMVDEIPEDFLREWALYVEAFAAMPYEVLIRFGRWDEILAQPDHYPEHMPFTKSFRHAARAIALAALGDTKAARAEQARYLELLPAVPAETMLGNNSAEAVFAVASPMVEGEILVREGRLEEGFAALRAAIAAEDELRYDEPPGWILPVRHALGANLMAHGRYAEAEQVYRDDLQRLPNNGWSLFGLADTLREQGKVAEAEPLVTRFLDVWRHADIAIGSSCFCQPGKAASPRLSAR
jgi:tetratricopeptide (TPR) repeat protein